MTACPSPAPNWPRSYPGFIEGAVRSGQDVAARVLQQG